MAQACLALWCGWAVPEIGHMAARDGRVLGQMNADMMLRIATLYPGVLFSYSTFQHFLASMFDFIPC
jgi:hypothetical protein